VAAKEARRAEAIAQRNEDLAKRAKKEEEDLERQQESDRRNRVMPPTVVEGVEKKECMMNLDGDEEIDPDNQQSVKYTFVTVNAKYESGTASEGGDINVADDTDSGDGRELADRYEEEDALNSVPTLSAASNTDPGPNYTDHSMENAPALTIKKKNPEALSTYPDSTSPAAAPNLETLPTMPGSWVDDECPTSVMSDQPTQLIPDFRVSKPILEQDLLPWNAEFKIPGSWVEFEFSGQQTGCDTLTSVVDTHAQLLPLETKPSMPEVKNTAPKLASEAVIIGLEHTVMIPDLKVVIPELEAKSEFSKSEAKASIFMHKGDSIIPTPKVEPTAPPPTVEFEPPKVLFRSRYPKAKQTPKRRVPSVEWTSTQQLIVFRMNAEIITKDWLKAQNIHLDKNKKRKRSVLSQDEFDQGREDSKKINSKRFKVETLRIGNGRA